MYPYDHDDPYGDDDEPYLRSESGWPPPPRKIAAPHEPPPPRRRMQRGTIVALVGVGMLILSLASSITLLVVTTPQILLSYYAVPQMPNTNKGQPDFPILTVQPGAPPAGSAVLVATTTVLAPVLTPTLTATPTGVACPPTSATTVPTLTGGTVRDGTAPAPMIAGCSTFLYISAPGQPLAPITISLTFGTANSISCSVYKTALTDAQGNAKVAIKVPDKTCFSGKIFTSGSITVGSDNSADANLPANG